MLKKIPDSVQKILDYRFVQALCAAPFVEKVYLYGSYARGDYDHTSDIDLAIKLKEKDRMAWIVVSALCREGDTLTRVDCVNFDDIHDREFKEQIIKEAVDLTELLK